jgi:hypothetical protein
MTERAEKSDGFSFLVQVFVASRLVHDSRRLDDLSIRIFVEYCGLTNLGEIGNTCPLNLSRRAREPRSYASRLPARRDPRSVLFVPAHAPDLDSGDEQREREGWGRWCWAGSPSRWPASPASRPAAAPSIPATTPTTPRRQPPPTPTSRSTATPAKAI